MTHTLGIAVVAPDADSFEQYRQDTEPQLAEVFPGAVVTLVHLKRWQDIADHAAYDVVFLPSWRQGKSADDQRAWQHAASAVEAMRGFDAAAAGDML